MYITITTENLESNILNDCTVFYKINYICFSEWALYVDDIQFFSIDLNHLDDGVFDRVYM